MASHPPTNRYEFMYQYKQATGCSNEELVRQADIRFPDTWSEAGDEVWLSNVTTMLAVVVVFILLCGLHGIVS